MNDLPGGDLHNAFFKEVHSDPWSHMVAHLYGDAWAEGYEQALRDYALKPTSSFPDLRERAVELLTERKRDSAVKTLVALAEAGRLLCRTPGWAP